MRITTQMLNESAHIGGNGKNALLDALNKKNSTVIDTENKKKYEKLGKTAEKLVDSSDALLQEGEKGLFAQVKESGDKQKLYDNIKTFFADYNSGIKNLKDTAGTMNDFYRQMLIEALFIGRCLLKLRKMQRKNWRRLVCLLQKMELPVLTWIN